MEGFTLIDGIAAGVIVLSAILAYSRGFVREAMAIVGWVGAAVLAFIFAPTAQPLVKEIPVLGEFLADSCELVDHRGLCRGLCHWPDRRSLFTPLFSSVGAALGPWRRRSGAWLSVRRGARCAAGRRRLHRL